MSKFKRFISILLVLGLCIGMLPPVSVTASETEETLIQETQETTAPVQTTDAAEIQEEPSPEETAAETEIPETEAVETTAAPEPEETAPAQTESGETVPDETEAAETEPAETEPAETVPAETLGEMEIQEESQEELYGVSNRVEQTITQAQFDSLLNTAKKTGSLELNARIVLTKNVTIPENVSLNLGWQGEIVVPSGKTLTVCGGGDISGYLIVEMGGTLDIQNTPLWLHNESYVEIQGNYIRSGWGCLYLFADNGTFNGTIFGVDKTGMGAYVCLSNDDYWEPCLDFFQDPDYVLITLGIQGNVTLSEDVSVGQNRNICVEGSPGNCLTIDYGVTLTTGSSITVYDVFSLVNNGTIQINQDGNMYIYGSMTNNGYIVNNWDIFVAGTLVNYGEITLKASDTPDYYTLLMLYEDGRMDNYGEVHCYGSGTVNCQGTWEYNDPIYHNLPRPVNVGWHKMVRYNETIQNAMGHIYWEVAEPENGEYVIQIYNADTDEQVFRTNGQFGGYQTPGRSMPAFIEADLPSGNYYFTVTSVSKSDQYEDSAPARSDVFYYTRPRSAIGMPRNVQWDGPAAFWTAPADANDLTSYEVHWYYAPDADSEPLRRSSNFNVYGNQLSLPYGMIQNCGKGYYSFKVRAMPGDITVKTIGAWAESAQFYYDPDTFQYDETYLDKLHGNNPPGMDPSIDFKYLQQPVLLKNNYSVAENVQLDIASGGSITVPAGKILILNNPTSVYNGGKLIVEEGGKLIVRQDLWVGYDCTIEIRGAIEFQNNAMAWFQYGHSFSMTGVPSENVMVEVLFDAGCTMVDDMLSFFENSKWGWTILRVEGDMTLPRSVTSPARSNIYIPRNSRLTVPQGMTLTIPQDAQMNVDGVLHNNGTIQGQYTGINPEAVIHITENGHVVNNGAVIANKGTVVDIQGTWDGTMPERNGGMINYPLSFKEFKAQVDALKSGGYLNLTQSVTLENSLTVPKNVSLLLNGGTIIVPKGKILTLNGAAELNEDSRLIVEAGGKLILNEQLWVKRNATLINNGTVTFGKNSYGEKARVYFAYDYGNEVTGISHADQILVMATDNFEFPGWKNYKAQFEQNDYAGVQLEIWGYYKAVLEEDLTVPANGMLIINPSWSDINNGTRNDWVTINSNVTVYGTMWINARYNGTPCNLEINGNVDIMPGGTLNVSGNVVNNGNVRVAVGASYNDYKKQFGAVWEGNYPEINLSEKDLRDKIASGAASVTLNNEIVLTKSLTIPQGVSLTIYGNGSLVVPAGVTLTVNERMEIWGGSLTVEPGGILKQNAYFIDVYDGATVNVQGSVQFKEDWTFVRHNDNGFWAESSVSGIPAAHRALSVYLSPNNEDYWLTALDLVENNTYANVFMLVTGSTVTLPRSMTIPENTLLHVDSYNTTLVIPEDCTLTNLGEVYVWNRNVLKNYGTIENHRGFYVYGQLYNYGDIQLNETQQMYESMFQIFPNGYLLNSGETSVNHEGYLLAVGTWEGNDPIDNGGHITMGRYAIPNDGTELLAGKSLDLKVWDYVDGKNLTDKQLTWSVAEEYAAYAALTAKGKLTAAKVTSRKTIEVVATVNETGERITATIDLLPAVSYVAVLDGETAVNGKTVTVDTSEAGRSFQLELYPLDLNANVSMDAVCTWTISDKKNEYASYKIKDGVLTVVPTGKAGTVTVKVSCNVGVKVDASFKLQFATFAQDIEIFNTETQLVGGSKLTLIAAVTPRYATQTDVIWSLKNPADKAYVSLSKNILKAQKVADSHEVVLVATSKDGMAPAREYTITILPQSTDILTLKHNGKSVTKGTIYADLNTTGAIELKAHLFGVEEEAADVTWTSSSAKVAAVSDGTVYLLGAGSATITAVCGSRKTSVTVKAARMASGVTVSGPNEVASGKAVQLKAAVLSASAQKVTWSIIQGEEYGKISTSGKFTANKNIISQQTVVISATAADGSNVASEPFEVTVYPVAQSVQIYTEQDGRWLNRSNTTFQWDMSTALENTINLDAQVFPRYGEGSKFDAIQSVTWKSSAPKVADIVNGQLVIYKTGTVTVTATAADGSGQKATFKLNVIKTVTSLTIADQTVLSGKSINLNKVITINPSDATNKKLTWTITYGADYATVSNGTFKAKKVTEVKTVEVTVKSQDGGASTTFKVTITP